MMSPSFILCFTLLISASKLASGKTLEGDFKHKSSKDLGDKIKTWLTSKINDMNGEMIAAEEELTNNYVRQASEAKNQIFSKIASMRNILAMLEEVTTRKRVDEEHSHFDAIKTESLAGFHVCANLTDILLNMKSAINESLALGGLLFTTLDSLVNGLNDCFPVDNPKAYNCLINFGFNIFESVTTLKEACETYGVNIRKLNKKITEEIYDCNHPVFDVNSKIENVLTNLKSFFK